MTKECKPFVMKTAPSLTIARLSPGTPWLSMIDSMKASMSDSICCPEVIDTAAVIRRMLTKRIRENLLAVSRGSLRPFVVFDHILLVEDSLEVTGLLCYLNGAALKAIIMGI